jgi:hypothetical protein
MIAVSTSVYSHPDFTAASIISCSGISIAI